MIYCAAPPTAAPGRSMVPPAYDTNKYFQADNARKLLVTSAISIFAWLDF
jgi:hypothetical protein